MGNIIYTIRLIQKYMVIEVLLCGLGYPCLSDISFFPRPELREHLALYTLHKTPMNGASPSGPPLIITSYEHLKHHLTSIWLHALNIDCNIYSLFHTSSSLVSWSSWLWHLLNTQNVPSSILGEISFFLLFSLFPCWCERSEVILQSWLHEI